MLGARDPNPIHPRIDHLGNYRRVAGSAGADGEGGAAEPDADGIIRPIKRAAIDARSHDVFDRAAGHGLRGQAAHEKPRDAGVAIREVEFVRAAIGIAGSQGNFELNVYKPVMIFNYLHSVQLLADSMNSFVEHCVTGIELDLKKIDHYVKHSLMLVTALAPRIGYDNAAKVAKTAHQQHISLREAAIQLGHLTREEFDALVNPADMTHP